MTSNMKATNDWETLLAGLNQPVLPVTPPLSSSRSKATRPPTTFAKHLKANLRLRYVRKLPQLHTYLADVVDQKAQTIPWSPTPDVTYCVKRTLWTNAR